MNSEGMAAAPGLIDVMNVYHTALYITQIAEQAASVCVHSGPLSCGDTVNDPIISEQRIRKKKSR